MVNGVMWAALADFVSIVKYSWISARQGRLDADLRLGLAVAMQPRCSLIVNVPSYQTVSENADRRLPSGSLSVQRHKT